MMLFGLCAFDYRYDIAWPKELFFFNFELLSVFLVLKHIQSLALRTRRY